MAIMASDEQALRVAIEFVKFKNATEDIQYGSGDRPPRYEIDSSYDPKKVSGSIVFTAVPKIPIERDDPQNEHHFERRMSVIVKTISITNEQPSVPILEATWRQKISDEQLANISENDLWPGFSNSKRDGSRSYALGASATPIQPMDATHTNGITTTAEADAFAKQNVKSSMDVTPVVTGDPHTIEGTDIKYWQVLYLNPSRPDEDPQPLIGSSTFLADNGQVLSRGTGSMFGQNPQPFKDWFLSQYRNDS